MVHKRFGAALVACALISGVSAYGVARASSNDGSVRPMATGSQQISSGPGVYAQTTAEYATDWSWNQNSAAYAYHWYIFTSGGSLVANGYAPSGGGGDKSVQANIDYFKEYNDEPGGSGLINVLTVNYCC